MARRYIDKPRSSGPKRSRNGLKVFLTILIMLVIFLAAFVTGIYYFSHVKAPSDDSSLDNTEETTELTADDLQKMSKDELVNKALDLQDELKNKDNQIDNLNEQLERYKNTPSVNTTPKPTIAPTKTPQKTPVPTNKPVKTPTPTPTEKPSKTPDPTKTPAPPASGTEG